MKPRLLVIASTFPAKPGDGTPGFVRDLALEEASEFEVMVVVPRVPGGVARENDGPLTVVRYPYWTRRFEDLADGAIIENLRARRSRWLQVPAFFFAQFLAVRRAMKEFRPDVIHAHWIIPQGVVVRLGVRKVPTLVTTLGGDLYALNAAPLKAMKRWVLARADAVTVMNTEMRDRVIALGAHVNRVSVLPMGADLATLSGVLAEEPKRAPSSTLRVLFVGRLVEKKGAALLLDAIREVQETTTVQLTIVGDGPLRESLEAASNGLDVSFLGQLGRDALARQYGAADVVAFPSVLAASGDQDGLPVALLEAMGAGACVVATNIAGINEAVEDERNGLLVSPGDSHELANAIRRLAADPTLRNSLASEAMATAQSYSSASVGERYRAILKGIIADR